MVLGYHVIFGAYGFWLPNDPRGSWSDFVESWDLFRYGPATTTTETRSLAMAPHDRALRMQAKEALKYPAVQFTGLQALAIGPGLRQLCPNLRTDDLGMRNPARAHSSRRRPVSLEDRTSRNSIEGRRDPAIDRRRNPPAGTHSIAKRPATEVFCPRSMRAVSGYRRRHSSGDPICGEQSAQRGEKGATVAVFEEVRSDVC